MYVMRCWGGFGDSSEGDAGALGAVLSCRGAARVFDCLCHAFCIEEADSGLAGMAHGGRNGRFIFRYDMAWCLFRTFDLREGVSFCPA